MSRFLGRLWCSFGNLLNVTSRGNTCSKKRIVEARSRLANRSDTESLRACFRNVGNGIAFSMKKYEHDKK